MGLLSKNNKNLKRLIDKELVDIILANLFLGIIATICITLPIWCYFNQPTWTIASWIAAFGVWIGLVYIYVKNSKKK